MKYLFLQAKVCCGWCIEAEYHVQQWLATRIVTDRIVDIVNQLQNCALTVEPR